MIQKIRERKQEINQFLEEYVSDNARLIANQWQDEIEDRLLEMVSEGKMVRGGLILETHDHFNGNQTPSMKAAAAIELAHTGLLIHDDIIDKDAERRGLTAMHHQYRQLGKEREVQNPEHYGDSMAIVIADVAFYLAFRLMSDLDTDKETAERASTKFWDYFSAVGMGEMMDIDTGAAKEELEEEEILELYRNKTANYTFSLPMATGAILAGADENTVEELEELGKNIGIIYQLRDDELGLFGKTDELGKPLGSDLEENKKTLHRLYLLEELGDEEAERIREMIGEDITREEKTEVLELMEEKNTREQVDNKIESLMTDLRERLDDSDIPEEVKDDLLELGDFTRNRTV